MECHAMEYEPLHGIFKLPCIGENDPVDHF